MEVFKKVLLILSFMILTVSSVQAEEHWPFPLGSECPFAWNYVSAADWQIELNGELANISFYISEESDSYMRIMTVVYDDNWDLLAFGSEVYKEKSFTLFLDLVDFRDDTEFAVKLRLYDNASKILPTAPKYYIPQPNKGPMCQNMSNISLAATVMTCRGPFCGNDDKNQILSRKNP